MAVDAYGPAGGQATESELADGISGKAVARNLENWFEGELCDWGDVGKPPILMLKGGEPQFGKTRQACLAQRENPGRLFRLAFEPLELFQVGTGFFHGRVVYRLDHPLFGRDGLSNRVRQYPRRKGLGQVSIGLTD